MKKDVYVGKEEDIACGARQCATKVSRRTLMRNLGVIGTGTAFFSAGAVRRAAAQHGPSFVDELSPQQLTAMYTDMLKIRLWESKVKDLILAGGFRGVAHLYVGEEAIAVGVCHALRKDDYNASNHRGHGHLIAKGGEPRRMLAEITRKASGYCKGCGGCARVCPAGAIMLVREEV